MNLTRDLVSTNDAKVLPRPEPKKQAQSGMVDSRRLKKALVSRNRSLKLLTIGITGQRPNAFQKLCTIK